MTKLLVFLIVSSATAFAEWEVRPTDERIEIVENGEALTSYHVSRVPYIYPLPSASGANLARQWPIEEAAEGENTDHPHHRSLWLSHGEVDGYDFWAWQGKGDPEIKHLGTRDVSTDGDHAAFTADLAWVADGKTLLKEERRHTFRRLDPETLVIEVVSSLTPESGDVVLGDTKEGTFALRVDRTLRLKGPSARSHILNSEGVTDGDTWGKRAKWVAFHGPDEKDEPAVIAILDHPENLRHPTWWHARDYGLLGANPFGIHHFENQPDKTLGDHTLGKDETLTQRYQVILHHGDIESAAIEDHWKSFSANP